MADLIGDRLVKHTEAARLLDIKPRTMREWTSDHSIPYVKIGGHTVPGMYRIGRQIRINLDEFFTVTSSNDSTDS